MGLFSWIFAKPCKDNEHNWTTRKVMGLVTVYCRNCGHSE
jgi:hypothetical protein